MKYKCLILDHDDTSVESSPKIHYPAFRESMSVLRPQYQNITLEEYFIKNFEPGFSKFLIEELGFSRDEFMIEYKIWRTFTESRIPDFFPGFLDLLFRFKKSGGFIAVVSHSEKDMIVRDYKKHSNILPDIIFGWDNDENKRKPSAYPVKEILKAFSLSEKDVIVIDDLKPGMQMARGSNVAVAAAGWGHKIPVIAEFMKKNCDFYFNSVEELDTFLFN
jgi:phosphoglycolate phosphatase-like HAD superfamily hydrolase